MVYLGDRTAPLFVLCLFLLLVSRVSIGQTKSWDGGALTHDWHDGGNWSPNGVPTATDYVRIQFDSVHLGSSASVQNIEIVNAQLSIAAAVAFNIDAQEMNALPGLLLDQAAILYNSGIISVFNTIDEGVLVVGFSQFFNQSDASLLMSDIGKEGVALYDSSRFINDQNALVQSTASECEGLIVDSSLFNNKVNATLVIDGAGSDACSNKGKISNRGTIIIRGPGNYGFRTEDSLINFPLGRIEIDSSRIGILNTSAVLNYGEFHILQSHANGSGIQSTTVLGQPAEFHNYGFLGMDSMDNEGIALGVEALMVNHDGGTIHIDQMLANFGEAILMFQAPRLINEGLIKIDGAIQSGIHMQSGQFINSDSILIKNITEVGLRQLQDTLAIDSVGLLQIVDCGTYLEIDSSANFEVTGELEVGN